jgi:hypothetical protein
MPDIITKYLCKICRAEFFGPMSAEACESTGEPIEYPVGTIYKHSWGNMGDMAICVAANVIDGHRNSFSTWLVSATANSADIPPGAIKCCHYGTSTPGRLTAVEACQNPNDASVQRMAALLQAKGIAPHVWDGTKAVAYMEWVANCAGVGNVAA